MQVLRDVDHEFDGLRVFAHAVDDQRRGVFLHELKSFATEGPGVVELSLNGLELQDVERPKCQDRAEGQRLSSPAGVLERCQGDHLQHTEQDEQGSEVSLVLGEFLPYHQQCRDQQARDQQPQPLHQPSQPGKPSTLSRVKRIRGHDGRHGQHRQQVAGLFRLRDGKAEHHDQSGRYAVLHQAQCRPGFLRAG
ncbi:hypothetical protein D3C76_903550 [compost metagenome]